MEEKINILKNLINQLRDMRSYTIKSDDLGEEELYYLQEGYRKGLCNADILIVDELDAAFQELPDYPEELDNGLMADLEEQWWHTHNDEGDIGSSDRY